MIGRTNAGSAGKGADNPIIVENVSDVTEKFVSLKLIIINFPIWIKFNVPLPIVW